MDIVVDYRLWLVAPVVCALIITVTGLAGTRRVLYTPPMQALKEV
jgi:hypothetical protein